MTVMMNHPIGTVAYLGGLPAVLEPFCWAWGQMIQYNSEYLAGPGQFVHYLRATASFHSFARNSLAEQFLGDWLLMLDTDHAPEPDLAARMVAKLNEYGCDVLTAVYVHKFSPYQPVLYQWDGRGMHPIHDWDRGAEAFQVGSAGAGALLIRRRVFDRIREELHEGPFDIIPPFGEDHSFFIRLDRLMIPAFAVPTIEAPHLEIRKTALRDHTPGPRSRHRLEVLGFG